MFQRPPSDIERICESYQGYRSNFGFRISFHRQIWQILDKKIRFWIRRKEHTLKVAAWLQLLFSEY